MAGPEENRLRAALTGAEGMAVSRGATDWQALSTLLTEVSMALKKSRVVAEELGGTTGPTLGGKFDRAAGRLDDRSRELQMGNQALTDSSSVIEQARAALHRMEQEHSAPEPAPFTPTPRWQLRTAQDVQDEKDRQGAHQGAANA